jgi:signal transduction histidine kinase
VRERLRKSITARVLLISAGIALLVGVAFSVLIVAIQGQRAAGRQALRSQEAVTAGGQLERTLLALESGVRGYVASPRDRLLEPFETGRRQYPQQVAALSRLVADDPGQQRAIRQIDQALDDYVALWAVPLLAIAREQPAVARSVLAGGNGRRRVEDIRARFRTLFARERLVAAQREAKAEDRSDVAVGLGFGGLAAVLLFSLGATLYLRRSVLRPILDVAKASETVAAGDLSARVPADRVDELGTLARSFNTMTTSLERNREELDHHAAELERSNRELEEYASVTSHDLQSPLVTISMYAELLRRKVEPGDDQQVEHLVGGIASATDRMRALIRDLLSYSRAGRGELHPELVDLTSAVRQVLDDLAGPVSQRGAEVFVGSMPIVRADRGQVGQLLQNLIGNALKFCDEDTPRIEVRAVREGRVHRLSVADNGIGIDPDEAERIFRPFHRLHHEDAYEGTGIGLAICQKIVSRHGGTIWAEGMPGEGTTFHFTLPAVDDDLPPVAAAAEPELAGEGQTGTIPTGADRT